MIATQEQREKPPNDPLIATATDESDDKELAERIVNLTLKQAVMLAKYLREKKAARHS